MGGSLMLGIETSCDDTSVALVKQNSDIVAIATRDQQHIHDRFGGIYPELAHRAHVRALLPVCRQVMAEAGLTPETAPEHLQAIAVTRGPGLTGALQVGVRFAEGLGSGWQLPVFGINHLRGHIVSARLARGQVPTPALVLLASGGHTLLAVLEADEQIRLLGETRDDAVGEAYDKVARMLGLGFPGGKVIDQHARRTQEIFPLPRPMAEAGLEFSFAGLKTAVRRRLEQETSPLTPLRVDQYCAAFVNACVGTLAGKCARALQLYPVKALVAVGGVAASDQLRCALEVCARRAGVALCLCPGVYATDNAAMIALAGWDYWRLGIAPRRDVSSILPVDQW